MPPRSTFYGWTVVYAMSLVSTVTAGLVFYNISVLLDAFVAERGFPVALTSVATGVFFVASGVAGVAAGYLIDRIDARLVIVVSACVAALALACVGILREPWQLLTFYAVFGLCYGGCGLVPTSAIVARWFHVRRAQALALASTGLSLGGILVTPFAALLIKQWGLAGAAPWLGLAFFLGVVPVTAFVVRASPQAMGLEPDGAAAPRSGTPTALPGVSFATAWRSRFFVALTGGYIFVQGAQVGAIAHIYRLVNVRTDEQAAAIAVALLAAASFVGRIASGWFLLRMPLRRFTIAAIAFQTLALVGLGWLTSRYGILAGTAVFGLTAGTILMMQQLLLADAFGIRNYGRIYSVSVLVTVLGIAAGPALMGILSETAGGYAAAYWAAAAVSLAGLGILLLARPPARPAAEP